jgi:hypothetical protein
MNLYLAEIAREEARKNYHGDTTAAIGNLQPLADLFDVVDDISLDTLNADWSGAFAFLCTALADIGLPVRYPDPRVHASFASVAAWEEYARLPKIRTWHSADEEPEIGDLVIFPPTPNKPPKMGIVLAVDEDSFDAAVGNHHNHSAVIEHSKAEGVRGYIRLKD